MTTQQRQALRNIAQELRHQTDGLPRPRTIPSAVYERFYRLADRLDRLVTYDHSDGDAIIRPSEGG